MKKFFLIAATTLAATAGFSQVKYGVQVTGGISGISTIVADVDNPKSQSQPVFGAAIVAEVPLAENLTLRPSLNYLQKKGKVTFMQEDKESSLKSTLNFIELPVDVAYSVPAGSNKVYVSAGPSLGYGISGKIKYNGWEFGEGGATPYGGELKAFSKDENDGANLKRLDFSAHFAAGLQLQSGLFVNAGYLLGLSNLAREEGKYKNRSLQLTVGYFFGGKK